MKALSNAAKHGVTFEEARTIFGDLLARIVIDVLHSADEERYFILGRSDRQRLLAVAYTDREERVRIISARQATLRERKTYEQTG